MLQGVVGDVAWCDLFTSSLSGVEDFSSHSDGILGDLLMVFTTDEVDAMTGGGDDSRQDFIEQEVTGLRSHRDSVVRGINEESPLPLKKGGEGAGELPDYDTTEWAG